MFIPVKENPRNCNANGTKEPSNETNSNWSEISVL
jgi:hypothetical protein